MIINDLRTGKIRHRSSGGVKKINKSFSRVLKNNK